LGRLVAPTPEQCLLLRAALLEGMPGRKAWEDWRARADIERLDPGSSRLLPQLYRNAQRYAVADPVLERLKGVYRHAWSANGLLLRDAGRLLAALARAGVRTVVLDGVALVTNYYKDHGARAIESLPLMVAPDAVSIAERVLADEGWPATESLPGDRPGPYASQVRLLGSGRPVDLLWDPFPEGSSPETRRRFWDGVEATEISGTPTLALAPADELLRICVRAARWEEPPPFRRLADAMTLLRGAGGRLDWERFLEQARRGRVVLPVLASLSLLRELLDAPVPEETLRRLGTFRAGAGERLEQRLRQAPRPRLGRLPDLVFRYRRLAEGDSPGVRRPTLASYLQGAWGVKRAWQVPLVALRKGVRRAVLARGG
jgi:hypothetical protein